MPPAAMGMKTKPWLWPKQASSFQWQPFCQYCRLGPRISAGETARTERLWLDLFTDPSQWWDNRFSKKTPEHPDFRHKSSLESLWIKCHSNPPWVQAKLAEFDLDGARFNDQRRSGGVNTFYDGEKVRQLCQEGKLREAIELVKSMAQKTAEAPMSAYVCLLKECGRRKALVEGKQVHDHIIQNGCDLSTFLANNLVDMYSKCGSVLDAHTVFTRMPRHNVFSWTSMISAYVNAGKCQEAIEMFQQMQKNGVAPDKIAFTVAIKACARIADLKQGKQLHSMMLERGFRLDMIVQSTLVDMYARCGCLQDAREVFNNMKEHNVVSWTAMIAGYAYNGHCEEALDLYEKMQREGVQPNKFTLVVVFKACTSILDLERGKQLHSLMLEKGIELDMIAQNSLVVMYAKCGSLEDAREVFDNMRERDIFSWNSMIGGYAQKGLGKEALNLYKQMKQEGIQADKVTVTAVLKACASIPALEEGRHIHSLIQKSGLESDVTVQSALVDMYARCGCLKDARELFDNMSRRDIVSWTAMIAGYAHNGLGKEAIALYEQMQRDNIQANEVTFAVLLKACASVGALDQGKQLHSLMLKRGFELDVFVQSTLVDMYAKCGCLEGAREVFNSMSKRNVVSWTAMIAGYAQKGLGKEALALYEQMKQEGVEVNKVTLLVVLKACASISALEQGQEIHSLLLKSGFESDEIVQNTLVDLYAKCGCLEDARKLFNNMRKHSVVSWNAMIAGYALNDLGKEALELYEQMKKEGVQEDKVTFTAVLKACASIGALEQGRQIHSLISERGLDLDVIFQGALLDMYAKCGCVEDACGLFNTSGRNVYLWTAMIAGYAQNGRGKEALRLYERMKHEGVQPNEITYICALSACSHCGLIEEGRHVFDSLINDSGITPTPKHYSGMVDIFGRAGCLVEAEDFIMTMPIEPDAAIWMSLLAAARNHCNMEIGKRAFDWVVKLEPENVSAYLLLIDILSSSGRMDEIAKMRREMNDKGLTKLAGCTWIEVDNQVHAFAYDESHPQSEQIWTEVIQLLGFLKKAGYTPDLSCVLDDMNDEEKEIALCKHSEKLAIVFGLIRIPPETPIRIKTNLRMCRDCHNASKIISKVVGRGISVMDENQVHHFKDGVCSCREYW